jgi:hypothetical protein
VRQIFADAEGTGDRPKTVRLRRLEAVYDFFPLCRSPIIRHYEALGQGWLIRCVKLGADLPGPDRCVCMSGGAKQSTPPPVCSQTAFGTEVEGFREREVASSCFILWSRYRGIRSQGVVSGFVPGDASIYTPRGGKRLAKIDASLSFFFGNANRLRRRRGYRGTA